MAKVVSLIFSRKMFELAGKNSCRGKATVLLCGVSSEHWSTIYCSNRLPASKALLGDLPTQDGRHRLAPDGLTVRVRFFLAQEAEVGI
jgi:hypothetical protein